MVICRCYRVCSVRYDRAVIRCYIFIFILFIIILLLLSSRNNIVTFIINFSLFLSIFNNLFILYVLNNRFRCLLLFSHFLFSWVSICMQIDYLIFFKFLFLLIFLFPLFGLFYLVKFWLYLLRLDYDFVFCLVFFHYFLHI